MPVSAPGSTMSDVRTQPVTPLSAVTRTQGALTSFTVTRVANGIRPALPESTRGSFQAGTPPRTCTARVSPGRRSAAA